MKYISRNAEPTLQRLLSSFPVVGVTGPRQSGKSTLLLHCLKTYRYVSFDEEKNIAFFEDDPEGFMRQFDDKVVFDEVQYVPKLFKAVKVAVEKDRKNYGKFVLTTSSQFAFLKDVTESLAGRIGLLSLLPFQYSEMPETLRESSIFKGSYPEMVSRSYIDSDLWYSAYLDTYLTKDVRALSNIGDMRDFRRLIQLLASQVGQILDMSSFARDLGVSVPTIKRWISILEASYIIFLLSPFHNHYGKRLIKRPKLYFYDTGLVSYLTGVKTKALFENGPLCSGIFENYVISDILKSNLHHALHFDCYFFRTQDGAEVDLIVDTKNTKHWIEIKYTATFRPLMFKTIRNYKENKDIGYLLYRGEKYPYGDDLQVIPYTQYLERYTSIADTNNTQ